jgi:hypothetical protein
MGWLLLLGLVLFHLAALWFYSIRNDYIIEYMSPDGRFGVDMRFGLIGMNFRWRRFESPVFPNGGWVVEDANQAIQGSWQYMPEDVLRSDPFNPPTDGDWSLAVVDDPFTRQKYLRIRFPHWFAAAVSGAGVWPWLGWVVFRHRRDRRRNRAGLCPQCGYDIRANPAKCSECGHEPGSLVRD